MTTHGAALPRNLRVAAVCATIVACTDANPGRVTAPLASVASVATDDLDTALRGYLDRLGFTGRVAGITIAEGEPA